MGVDFLYSSACCLVFVIQERMTGRGLHWLYAGIACQYPFLQLLFWCKEWAPSVQHTSHVPEHPETQSKLNASGVLKHHLQHLEIYFRAYTDLSRSYLFFSLKSRSFLFFFFFQIMWIWEVNQSVPQETLGQEFETLTHCIGCFFSSSEVQNLFLALMCHVVKPSWSEVMTYRQLIYRLLSAVAVFSACQKTEKLSLLREWRRWQTIAARSEIIALQTPTINNTCCCGIKILWAFR